ncbi:Butyrophilin subfamily 3 member A2 [Platysternon megacephalum]|uniref:Butyrophilin subfamily 3 member A2 n=1 Tax=Platysternon megacephalum TaxID=55544 RepID=A0A4D9DQV0_9SAUR|nr:Butyrophilin subfamily 3 member A2 [Platysternon megacephalum]
MVVVRIQQARPNSGGNKEQRHQQFMSMMRSQVLVFWGLSTEALKFLPFSTRKMPSAVHKLILATFLQNGEHLPSDQQQQQRSETSPILFHASTSMRRNLRWVLALCYDVA